MSDAEFHEMRRPQVAKVVAHMSVGVGGEELQQAETILSEITGQEPVRTTATESNRDFDIRTGDPIGAKTTLRDDTAHEFLETALEVAGVSRSQFDQTGNVSFGVAEHTEFPSQEYDPSTGIYGLDVTVNLVRPGNRISQRDKQTQQIPTRHRVTPEDAIAFLEDEFEVEL